VALVYDIIHSFGEENLENLRIVGPGIEVGTRQLMNTKRGVPQLHRDLYFINGIVLYRFVSQRTVTRRRDEGGESEFTIKTIGRNN
jgi:hypothetical protein